MLSFSEIRDYKKYNSMLFFKTHFKQTVWCFIYSFMQIKFTII